MSSYPHNSNHSEPHPPARDRRRAFITGITGQDGSYLAEFLLSRGYQVHGLVRRVSTASGEARTSRINHILDRVILHYGCVTSTSTVSRIFEMVQPDECYHLAAQSFVPHSFDDEQGTMHTNVDGTLAVLAAVRGIAPRCRFYFAGSSEMFGRAVETPQDESTSFYPRSPYGVSKAAGHYLTRNYREAWSLHASSGILFNHESPRRGVEFVTRKVSTSVARIMAGKLDKLKLGNLEARRDWGHAREYVQAMWLMLQQDQPDDYVIATGTSWTVREFVQVAFEMVGLDWTQYVVEDAALRRPAEVDTLRGDITKARQSLGWEPKISLRELIREMIDSDLAAQGLAISPASKERS
jgi:GDPmannose 4,6-dehydratase